MDQVFSDYFSRLLGIAHRQLHQSLRGKVDCEDVVISAMKSFFILHESNQIDSENPDSVFGLLAKMVKRKCIRQIEKYGSQKRSLKKEVPIEGAASLAIFSREPTPAMVAMVHDTFASILNSRTPKHRRVIALHLEGKSVETISSTCCMSERTVERVLYRLRVQLETEFKEG